jgi:hypothetical protein
MNKQGETEIRFWSAATDKMLGDEESAEVIL